MNRAALFALVALLTACPRPSEPTDEPGPAEGETSTGEPAPEPAAKP